MKNIGFKILYVVTALVIIVEIAFGVKGSLFSDISQLPKGELSYSIKSPSGNKSMNIYVVSNNLGCAVRGEIETPKKSYNIFWQTGIDNVDAKWTDDNYVIINDILLDIRDTFGYDSRRGTSLFDEGSLEENFIPNEEK